MKKYKLTDPVKYAFLNQKQLALKLVSNSDYGTFGTDTFNKFCLEIASAITLLARHQILSLFFFTYKFFWKWGFTYLDAKIFYGDTDSLFTSIMHTILKHEQFIDWVKMKYLTIPYLNKLVTYSQPLNDNDYIEICKDKWSINFSNDCESAKQFFNDSNGQFISHGNWRKHILNLLLFEYGQIPRCCILKQKSYSWDMLTFNNDYLSTYSNTWDISTQFMNVEVERYLTAHYQVSKKGYLGLDNNNLYSKGVLRMSMTLATKLFLTRLFILIFTNHQKYIENTQIEDDLLNIFEQYIETHDDFFIKQIKLGKALEDYIIKDPKCKRVKYEKNGTESIDYYSGGNIKVKQMKQAQELLGCKFIKGDLLEFGTYNYFTQEPFLFQKFNGKEYFHNAFFKSNKESTILITQLCEYYKKTDINFPKDFSLDKGQILLKEAGSLIIRICKSFIESNFFIDFNLIFLKLWKQYFPNIIFCDDNDIIKQHDNEPLKKKIKKSSSTTKKSSLSSSFKLEQEKFVNFFFKIAK